MGPAAPSPAPSLDLADVAWGNVADVTGPEQGWELLPDESCCTVREKGWLRVISVGHPCGVLPWSIPAVVHPGSASQQRAAGMKTPKMCPFDSTGASAAVGDEHPMCRAGPAATECALYPCAPGLGEWLPAGLELGRWD